MRGNAVPANYIKRHGVLLVRASRPTTLTLCARLKATRLWSYGCRIFSGCREKLPPLVNALDVSVTMRPYQASLCDLYAPGSSEQREIASEQPMRGEEPIKHSSSS